MEKVLLKGISLFNVNTVVLFEFLQQSILCLLIFLEAYAEKYKWFIRR